MLEVTGYVKLD